VVLLDPECVEVVVEHNLGAIERGQLRERERESEENNTS
jgi:hypothetical protein